MMLNAVNLERSTERRAAPGRFTPTNVRAQIVTADNIQSSQILPANVFIEWQVSNSSWLPLS